MKRRRKFQDYLEMELGKDASTAAGEAAFQRRLAKQLKLKRGKLDDVGDGLAGLLAGIGSEGLSSDEQGSDPGDLQGENDHSSDKDEDSDGDGGDGDRSSGESESGEQSSSGDELEAEPEQASSAKYVPPHQRKKDPSEDEVRVKRRIKGLLNRLSEDNVETLTSEIAEFFQFHSRSFMTETITDHVLESCSSGPRGNEQYAAVFAASISGTACLVGMDFGANFMAGVASCFERQYEKKDGLAVRNLTLLISSLYSLGLITSELVYDLLHHLCKRFQEIDVATILHIIRSCGMALRTSDPVAMKEFILAVQECTLDLKRSTTNGEMPKRVEFMLEAICEVKNNKRRVDEPARHPRMKKWLQKLKVEDVQLRSLPWKKLVDPQKKGQWWLGTVSNEADEAEVPKVVDLIDSGVVEAEKMLKLAAAQRMNTDARRAIFSIVMSSEDYIDAFEKLLRLTLMGKQDREIMRVILECCLQEKVFNKYYALLASKLCHHDKNHRFTLQYCVWDQFKELASMEARRSINLAKFLAFLVGSSALSLTALKAVDFGDSRTMTARVVVHFRAFFEALLTDKDDTFVSTAFSRIARAPELSALQAGVAVFLRRYVKPTGGALLQRKCLIARKALSSATTI
ncbi:nucleolar MIF4G domain-containing protein 1 [Selaginella moellendorffii]|nr:nucleolar MIF4G domain-containing protein 1 [Selaginella moellendorffii]|eukprot:XP_002980767.2 nucleolar MIF4G domain-containing protein 1 [Selaginella moellendorffii]